MCKNNVLYNYQFGFSQKHSAQHAIITHTDTIHIISLDNGDIAITILLDLKKAFDTVIHRILLQKLNAYGIRGNMLKWFESYLITGRSQYDVYDGIKSDIYNVTCGVPQGSILGPLLFILNMNGICNVSELLFTILYADDTCVLLSGKDLTKLITVSNAELKFLSAWFRSNKLTVNTYKTFFMIFHHSRVKYNSKHCIKIDDCSLNKVISAKYLGVIIDYKLNWIDHIAYIKNKISKGIGIMYRARNFLNKSSLIGLYYSYIYPYFTYCLETWGCASKTQLNPLFLLQKKIIRIMTFLHYLAHTEHIFNDLHILPFHKLFLYSTGIFMYKYSINCLPLSLCKLYVENSIVHQHNTRNCDTLKVSKGTKTFIRISALV